MEGSQSVQLCSLQIISGLSPLSRRVAARVIRASGSAACRRQNPLEILNAISIGGMHAAPALSTLPHSAPVLASLAPVLAWLGWAYSLCWNPESHHAIPTRLDVGRGCQKRKGNACCTGE